MTREEFDKLKVGDKVRHAFGGIGIVTRKDKGTYTVLDTGFSPNAKADKWSEVNFAWNEGEILK